MSDYLELAEQVVDAYNNKDVDVFIDMYALDADVEFPDQARPNREEMIAEFQEIIEAVPDRWFDVSRIVTTESGAVVECITRGTNTGSLFGNPPTNRQLAVPFVHIYDFEKGKIIRQRTYANYMILMQQLGISSQLFPGKINVDIEFQQYYIGEYSYILQLFLTSAILKLKFYLGDVGFFVKLPEHAVNDEL